MLDTVSDLAFEDPADGALVIDNNYAIFNNANSIIHDDELNEKIRSLNRKQRQILDIIHDWAKRYVKNLQVHIPFGINTLIVFITGNGGCGKSHLIRTIYHSLTKTLSNRAMSSDKPKVLLLASTDVAAINIDGTTIHTGLSIPVGYIGKNLPRLTDKMRSSLRNKLCELRDLIIDEISMVSNLQLLYIHLKLFEIFGCSDNIPFAGIIVVACGDLLQLLPFQQRAVYAEYRDVWQNLFNLWKLFKIAELFEVMRQNGDSQLIDLLNKVRIASLNETDEQLLKSRFVVSTYINYPFEALHIFAENKPAHSHNLDMGFHKVLF